MTAGPRTEALEDLDGGLRDAALEYVEAWDAYHVEDNQYTQSRLQSVYRTRTSLQEALAGDLIEYPGPGPLLLPARAATAAPVAPVSPDRTEARRAAFDEVLAAVEGLPRYYLGNDAEPQMVELAAVIQAVTELRDRS